MKLISLVAISALTLSPLAVTAGSDAGKAAAGGETAGPQGMAGKEWDCPYHKDKAKMGRQGMAPRGYPGQGPGPMMGGQGPGPMYGQRQGYGPMMGGPRGGMPGMGQQQYDRPMMGPGMGGGPQAMQERMDAMESHLSNIEQLLQQLVEMEKE